MAVPLFDIATPLAPLRETLAARARTVLESGVYILGPEVAGFEAEWAAHLGRRHAVGVGNGTDAITLALEALGVGDDDEVVVPSFTFYASAEAIPPTGARPVFCDIDPATGCVTADTVRRVLSSRTRAVVAVHLFGNVAPVAEIEALGVPVVEDAAQAAGSWLGERRAGALGRVATFSFYPSKNLGGFGDGGAVVTDDAELAERVRMLRGHGSRDKQTYELVGRNSRLDGLQAALLRVQLPHLDSWAEGRRRAAEHYAAAGLAELVTPPIPTRGARPAWHLFVIRHHRADALAAGLSQRGIGARAYYRRPVHRQPAMAAFCDPRTPLPGTDAAARSHLALPMSPVLSAAQAEEVVAGVRGAL